MSEKLSEKQLLHLISKGNQSAFHEIYERYKDKIYSFAIYLTHTEFLAEEITQEVFISIWTTRERLAAVESFNSYLIVIAKNVASNHLKKYALERIIAGKIAETVEKANVINEDKEQEDALLKIHHEAIGTLSPQQQRVYTLHHIKGLKNREIADSMGISVYTVKEYLKIASKTVRDYVGKRVELMVILALNIFLK